MSNDGERRVVDQMGGALHFRPVKKDDEGMYICRAFNDVGSDDSRGKLEVIGECHPLSRVVKSFYTSHELAFECVSRLAQNAEQRT